MTYRTPNLPDLRSTTVGGASRMRSTGFAVFGRRSTGKFRLSAGTNR